MAIKPSSIAGVCLTTVERFPEMKQLTPGPDVYEQKTFVHLLDSHIGSRREVLNSIEKKSFMDKRIQREMNPGPGTYDINSAIGRHVANDARFALLKSDRLKNHQSMTNSVLLILLALLIPKLMIPMIPDPNNTKIQPQQPPATTAKIPSHKQCQNFDLVAYQCSK
ncbi:UNVERIFIED_CONTAM: hypothetical protein HDU68_006838 [Siphonaria sp. JEL0065]|nr:hypothetical protein HDU68_006838 [Siphonaria sp. JEL0065]